MRGQHRQSRRKLKSVASAPGQNTGTRLEKTLHEGKEKENMLVASPPPFALPSSPLLLLSYMQLSLHLARLRCSKAASVDVVFSPPPHRSSPLPEPNVQPSASACGFYFFTPSSPQKSAQALTSFGQRHFPFALMRRGGKGSTKTFAFFFFPTPSLPASSPAASHDRSRLLQKKKEGGEKKISNSKIGPSCSPRASIGGRARSAIDGRANAQL